MIERERVVELRDWIAANQLRLVDEQDVLDLCDAYLQLLDEHEGDEHA